VKWWEDLESVAGRLPTLPRGPIWKRAADRRPEWALPWHNQGLAFNTPANDYRSFFRETLKNHVNGLRVERVTFTTAINFQQDLQSGFRVLVDGSPYDATWSLLKLHTAQASHLDLDCYLVFEAGATIEFGVQAGVSILNAAAYARGYYF